MLFVDEIVLIDETRSGVNDRMKVWRHALGSKDFRLSKTKTEYIKCKFNDMTPEARVMVSMHKSYGQGEVSSILGYI